jgi:hypothetical protein
MDGASIIRSSLARTTELKRKRFAPNLRRAITTAVLKRPSASVKRPQEALERTAKTHEDIVKDPRKSKPKPGKPANS